MRRGSGPCRLCGSEEWFYAGERDGIEFYLCPRSHEWPGVWQPGQEPPERSAEGIEADEEGE